MDLGTISLVSCFHYLVSLGDQGPWVYNICNGLARDCTINVLVFISRKAISSCGGMIDGKTPESTAFVIVYLATTRLVFCNLVNMNTKRTHAHAHIHTQTLCFISAHPCLHVFLPLICQREINKRSYSNIKSENSSITV